MESIEESKQSVIDAGSQQLEKKGSNFLEKNKYPFFMILSYFKSRAEAKLLLYKLSKRGQQLCGDQYLDIFKALIYNINIRKPEHIPFIKRLGTQSYGEIKFNDDLDLGLFFDFKRESKETITKLIDALQTCKNVKHLTVSGSPNPFFTDSLFGMLATNDSITKLDVDIEYIPWSSFNALQLSLQQNKTLEELFFKKFAMSNTYMEQIATGLNRNPEKKIRAIGFHDVQIQPFCLKPLLNYLEQIDPKNFEELSLSNIEIASNADDMISMLKANTNLKILKIIHCEGFFHSSAKIAHALSTHVGLEELHISSMQVTSELLVHIMNLIKDSKIKKIILDGLGHISVQDYVMEKLKVVLGNTQTLEYLDLSNTVIPNIAIALEGLVKNKSLRTLKLTSCHLQTEALVSLASALKYNTNLQHLDINFNPLKRESPQFNFFVEALAMNQSLTHLDMKGIPINEAFINCLRLNKGLQYLRIKISSDQVHALYSALENNQTMRICDLQEARIPLEMINLLNSLTHITFDTHDDRV